MSARKRRNRGKHPISRRDQPRTDQSNNPTNHGKCVPSDAVVKQEPVRLGLVSLAASLQLTEDPHVNGDEESKSRALQEFGPSHPRANELGGAQSAGALRAPAAAFSGTQPARTGRSWKVLVVLFVILVPVGFVSLVGMKDPPLLAFGDWWASHHTAASASLSSQDPALHSAPDRRLAIHEARGIPGEPLPIGTSLEGVAKDAVVMITGLTPGMTLSTGSAIGANAWRVPATEFVDTWIGPPTDFSGAVDVTVELHLPDQSIADRRRFRLEWAAPSVLASANSTISLEPAAPALSPHHGSPRLVDGSANSARTAQEPDTIPSAPLDAGVNSVSAAADPTVVGHSPSVPSVPAHAAPALVVASAHPRCRPRPQLLRLLLRPCREPLSLTGNRSRSWSSAGSTLLPAAIWLLLAWYYGAPLNRKTPRPPWRWAPPMIR